MKKIVKLVKNVGADDPVRPQPNRNTQNGITLVALVITIIVLLLLAVVSINIVQSSGLIEKTKLAKEEHRASAIQEQIDLLKNEQEIAKQNNETEPSINELIDKLQEQKLITEEDKNTIMQTGKITIGSKELTFSTDAILPQGYTKCEYLESTGTQYIDTKIKCSDINYFNYEIEAHIQNLSQYTDQQLYALVGAYEVGKAFQFGMVTTGTNEERITMNMSFDSAIFYTGLKLGEWRTLYSSSGTQKMNNNVIANKQSINDFTDLTFYLFGRNGIGNYRQLNKQKLTYIYIKSNGKTILNLISCLDYNNRPCMYDTVSGQTFYNQGTGEFIAGPVIE